MDKRKHGDPNNDDNRNASQKETNIDRHAITVDVKGLDPLVEEPISVDGDVEIISPTKRKTSDTSANDKTDGDQPSLKTKEDILRNLANSLNQSKSCLSIVIVSLMVSVIASIVILFPLLCGVDVRRHTSPCSSVVHFLR